MAEVTLYNIDGSKAGSLPLPDGMFAVAPKQGVIHTAIVAQDANSRVAIAHTKDRSEVSGGGKKPWKQKGTGRARHGSTRSPIWVGGGVAFGPRNERNFSLKINKATKRLALMMALTDKVQDGAFVAVNEFAMPEAKTKLVSAMRKALPGASVKALLVVAPGEEAVARAARNLKNTEVIRAASLNVRDVAKFRYLIVSKVGVQTMIDTFGG